MGQLPLTDEKAIDSSDLSKLFDAVTDLRARVREQMPDVKLPSDIVFDEATPNCSG